MIAIGIDWDGRHTEMGVDLAKRGSASSRKGFVPRSLWWGLQGALDVLSNLFVRKNHSKIQEGSLVVLLVSCNKNACGMIRLTYASTLGFFKQIAYGKGFVHDWVCRSSVAEKTVLPNKNQEEVRFPGRWV